MHEEMPRFGAEIQSQQLSFCPAASTSLLSEVRLNDVTVPSGPAVDGLVAGAPLPADRSDRCS